MASIIATDKGGADFELIEPGSYGARAYMMIHIGTVKETYGQDVKEVNKVLIGWEVPEVMRQWKEGEPEMPAVISKEYTVSLSKKSNLRGDLEAWRGVPFTEKEAEGFDLVKLVGAPCLLGIVQKPSAKDATKVYNNINSIMKMPKGMSVPEQVHPSKIFTYDNMDLALLESLPDWIKDKVKRSKEYGLATGLIKPEPPISETAQTLGKEEDESDLPF